MVSKDHVHLFVSAPPNLAPSEIMRRIKGGAKIFSRKAIKPVREALTEQLLCGVEAVRRTYWGTLLIRPSGMSLWTWMSQDDMQRGWRAGFPCFEAFIPFQSNLAFFSAFQDLCILLLANACFS